MEDQVLVSQSLSRAFFDDPFYQAVTVDFAGDSEKRAAVLSRYFELAIDEALRIGEVVCAGTVAAAIWITQKAGEAELFARGDSRTRSLKALLGSTGFENYRLIGTSMAANVAGRLADDAWYLSILGVHPSLQGRGIAQGLLRSTLSRADGQGARCFLETFNPLSLPFYERMGFGEAVRCFEAVTRRPYWILAREPSRRLAHA